MWRLDVSSEAELEIFEAALRYERERAGLGFRFEAQVNTVSARLLENPFQFPAMEEGARRALVRDFPYGVFFTTVAVVRKYSVRPKCCCDSAPATTMPARLMRGIIAH